MLFRAIIVSVSVGGVVSLRTKKLSPSKMLRVLWARYSRYYVL
jgi:hypothetical protein